MLASLGRIMSTTEGVEMRYLLSFLRPLAPLGALMVSLARWVYSFLFQLMAMSAASRSPVLLLSTVLGSCEVTGVLCVV